MVSCVRAFVCVCVCACVCMRVCVCESVFAPCSAAGFLAHWMLVMAKENKVRQVVWSCVVRVLARSLYSKSCF
jgi:hypothetical protein